MDITTTIDYEKHVPALNLSNLMNKEFELRNPEKKKKKQDKVLKTVTMTQCISTNRNRKKKNEESRFTVITNSQTNEQLSKSL